MSELQLGPLTVGIEVEFILAHPPLGYTNGKLETAETMRNRYVHEPLRAAGLCVGDQERAEQNWKPTELNRKWLVTDDMSVVVTPADLEAANGTFANGCKLADMGEVEYTDVELVSPVMTLTVECMKEIQLALEVVRRACVLSPKSAGMHVHIGNNGNLGFSLPLVQNLTVLMLCFEQQFNQAVPYHRLFSHYCHLPRCMVPTESRAREHMAWYAYEMQSIDGLIEAHYIKLDENGKPAWSRNMTFNLPNLHSQSNTSELKKTVEFRQQGSSLDDFEVLRWVVTVATIVQVAGTRNQEFFSHVIKRHTKDDGEDDWNFSLLDLFDDLGVDFLKPLWENRGLNIWPEGLGLDEEFWCHRQIDEDVLWPDNLSANPYFGLDWLFL